MYNKGLYNDWVPKSLQLLLIVLMLALLMPLSGVYTGNITSLSSGLGTQSEYFLWANYANTIGMGACMPIVVRLKQRFKVRDKIIFILIALAILCFINATATSPMIFVFTALLIGFLKMIASLEFFLPLMVMMGNRGFFYGAFYTFVLVLQQLASYYATEVSLVYNWQQFYILAAIACLLMAVLHWFFMHDKYFAIKMPLHYIDWMSIVLFVSTFMFSAYVYAFGKQQDWWNSRKIIHASLVAFVSFGMLCVRQLTLKRPYLSFNIFKKSNVVNGLIMLFFLGMYLGTASIQNTFSMGVLGYDQLTNAKLSTLLIPGIIVSGILAMFWFKKELPVKMFVFSGFSAMLGYAIIMYFSMVLEFGYNNWYLPMFLKGYGMGALFISVWYYTLDKLELNDMIAAIGLVLVWRTFLAVGIFSTLYSWFQYRFQIESIGNAAVYLDGMTITPQTLSKNIRLLQLNAIIVATKRIFGYIIITGSGVLVYVLFHHFGRERFEQLKFMKALAGKTVITRRRLKERKKFTEGLKDAAGSVI